MAPKLSSKTDWKATPSRFRPDSAATPRHHDTAIPPKLAWGPILSDFCSLLCLIFDSRIGGTGRQAFAIPSTGAQGALGAFGPLKEVASLRAQGALGAFGPLKKSLRSGPKGPKGPLGPLKSRFAPGSMPGIPQNGRLHLLFHARKSTKWAASPPILGGSGHEIKGVADHFGGFRAWIPERSDFFKGPKGPKGPLGLAPGWSPPEPRGHQSWSPHGGLWAMKKSRFALGPRGPWGLWAP